MSSAATKWSVMDLFGTLIAGGVNGYALVALQQNGMGMLGLALGGIVAYGVATIIARILTRIVAPSTSTPADLMTVLKVEDWPKYIIWGAMNGVAFFLLQPYVGYTMIAGVLLGTATYYLSKILTYLMAF